MIVVTGATGHFGGATIDALLAKGIAAADITALVRNSDKAANLKAKGVNLKVGDYDDSAALEAAFSGAEKLLLVSGTDIAKRQEQHARAVDAAKTAGVRHIVYTSFHRNNAGESNPLGIVAQAHMATDAYIAASGIPWTIMQNTLYAEVLPMFFGEKVLESGIYFPAGRGRVPYTSRVDMAEAAAVILSTEGHVNKSYVIAGHDHYTLDDVAAMLSEIAGRSVAYTDPGSEAYIATLAQAGVPQEYAEIFAAFGEAIRQGEFETGNGDLATLIGRPPAALKNYLKSVYTSTN